MDKHVGKGQELSTSSLSLYTDSPKPRLRGKKGIVCPIPTYPDNFGAKAAVEKAKLECHKMVPPALRDASAVYPGRAPSGTASRLLQGHSPDSWSATSWFRNSQSTSLATVPMPEPGGEA